MTIVQEKMQSRHLPHDVIHEYIIPYVLARSLHDLFINQEEPRWRAVIILQGVSLAFKQSCLSLYPALFGVNRKTNISVVLKMIAETEQLWKQVKEPPMNATDIEDLTHSQLIERPSLIKIYYCTALARISLNVEVLAYPTGTQHIRDLITYLFGSNDDIQDAQLNIHTADKDGTRKMSDANLHKIFLPLMSALELCEMIQPEWLCHMAVKYLADNYVVISSAPLLLKYSQDLHYYMEREYNLPVEVWAEWALICLRLIQRLETLLDELRCRSPLVVQYSPEQIILNEKVIKITAILVRLSKTITCDWGEHTEEIKELASSIISKWRHLYIKGDVIGNSTVAQ